MDMKKVISFIFGLIQGIIITLAFLIIMGWAGYMESTYDASGVIVNETNNMLTIEDTKGHLWDYEIREYFHKGEKVKITLFDNHTHTIYDDEIVKIKRVKN